MPKTDSERYFEARGVNVVELGLLHDAEGTHVALLLPDKAQIGRRWFRQAGHTSGRIFSLSGGTARAFRLTGSANEITLSLFPVDLGERLLAQTGGLDPQDRFRIAAYIRAYYGSLARIMGKDGREDRVAQARLAQAAGQDASIFEDRAALDADLAVAGWRPTHDMLERLSIADPWIRHHLLPTIAPRLSLPLGVTVYFLRKHAVSLGFVDRARAAIASSGFEILAEKSLSPETAEILRTSTRGGNWRKGSFPVSGGPPAHLYFVLDVFAHPPDAKTRRRHPLLDNGRTLACKERVRTSILAKVPQSERFNPVHSTDTSHEAAAIASSVLGTAAVARLAQVVTDRLTQVARLADQGAAVAPGGDSFIYLRRGILIRKLYRPHLAADAGAALAFNRALGPRSAAWGQMLDGSAEAGYLDFADPGERWRPLADCPLPLDRRAAEHLRQIVQEAETAGWRIDCASLFDSLWYSADPAEVIALGAQGVRGKGGLSNTMSRACWRAVLGMPRAVFLQGGPLRRNLWRQVIYPGRSWATRLHRRSRRGISRLRQLTRC